MQPRMTHPAMTLPDAMAALQALNVAVQACGLPQHLLELVNLRASQINACSVCVELHARDLKTSGQSDERLFAVAAWRESPHFDDSERAALALTEAATRIGDRADPVPDTVWQDAADHFDDRQLAGLVIAIANINLWNRLNTTTRQIAGAGW